MSVELDAADLISSLSTGSYVVTRTATGTFSHAIAVPGESSMLSIEAAVYPATGRDLLRLPELRRSIETKIVFTTTRLYAGAEQGTGSEANYEADQITIDGDAFEVQQSGAWPGMVGYYRAVVQAIEDPS